MIYSIKLYQNLINKNSLILDISSKIPLIFKIFWLKYSNESPG